MQTALPASSILIWVMGSSRRWGGRNDVTYTCQTGPPTTDSNSRTLSTRFCASLCVQPHEEGAGGSWRHWGFTCRENARTFQYWTHSGNRQLSAPSVLREQDVYQAQTSELCHCMRYLAHRSGRHLQSPEEGLWGVLGALASVVTPYSYEGGPV